MAYYEGKPISGVIPIFYGNKTWYLYGASSNEHRNLNAKLFITMGNDKNGNCRDMMMYMTLEGFQVL